MDITYAIKILKEIRSEWFKPIRSKTVSNERVINSGYTSWAFDEIYFWLLAHESGDPILAVEELKDIASDTANETSNEDKAVMFFILCDICEDVLEVWKLMGITEKL